jgi:D-psicose/D-tagatose/L-ribulose 3-epimerase
MKLAVNTLLWQVDFTPADLPLLTRLKAHGFDGVEIAAFEPKNFQAAAIRRGVEDNGLECIICSVVPKGLSLISDDAAVRGKTRERLRDVIKVAADTDARMIAGPLYCPVGYLPGRRRTADEWRWAVEGYQSITDDLTSHNVTLAIEPLNRFETYFLNTSADAAALCAAVGHPRVGVSFDTFHSNIEDKDLGAAIRGLGPHLKYVQASENDRGTPGSGHVGWRLVLDALRDAGYDGWIAIESFAANLADFSSAVCIWRDIEPVTESIAFDGIKFLRTLIAQGR